MIFGSTDAGTFWIGVFKASLPLIWANKAAFVWPVLLILIAVLGRFVYWMFEKYQLSRSGIAEIDIMDGKTFEKYLAVLFGKLGYRVERTRYVGDYGADLVTVKSGKKTVIQAKRYKKNVGVKAIQEAVAAKGFYNCDNAMVVCNSYFTKQALVLAKANKVTLWNRDDLIKALLSVKKDEPKGVPENSTETSIVIKTDNQDTDLPSNLCAVCGEPVSDKVRQYCLDHADRFGGQIYCFQH